MKSFLLSLLIILSLVSCTSANRAASTFPQSSESVQNGLLSEQELYYIRARTTQVSIDCSPVIDLTDVFKDTGIDPERAFDGRGSGAILKSSENLSYIVTANHVVENKFPEAFDCKVYIAPEIQRDGLPEKMEAKI